MSKVKWGHPWYLDPRPCCAESHGRLASKDPTGQGAALLQFDQFVVVLPCHTWARQDLLLQSQGKVSFMKPWGPVSASGPLPALTQYQAHHLTSDKHSRNAVQVALPLGTGSPHLPVSSGLILHVQ